MKVVILYLTIILLTGVITHLTGQMVDRSFSTIDMTRAYSAGCSIGLHGPLTYESISRCDKLSTTYGQTLEELMNQ